MVLNAQLMHFDNCTSILRYIYFHNEREISSLHVALYSG